VQIEIAKYHEQLKEIGLASLSQVKAFQGELVKNHRGRRDILRITLPGAEGKILFLKRNWKPYKKDGLGSLLRRGKVWSLSRQEWENSKALASAGLSTAEPIAFGEDCGPLWERFSFIITAAAHGTRTLDDFMRVCRGALERRRLFDALAGEIRRMHAAGLASPDLFARHIFVDTQSSPPRFCLIDMARVDRRQPLSSRLRARDLAALNLTAPMRFVSVRERLRFVRVYAGKLDRELVARIESRTRRLMRRSKFHEFAPAGQPGAK
jgi:heptose I phosphotransferase